MTQQCIPLHLPQPDAAVLLAAFHRLLRECSHGAGAADLRLVTHHVSASSKVGRVRKVERGHHGGI